MIFHILTLFPEFFEGILSSSILKKAIDNNIIKINLVDIRDYSKNKHKNVDDYPYGGGPGMVMTPEPIYEAIEAIRHGRDIPVIYPSPRGKKYNQSIANNFSKLEEVILICGHYEGIDQRVIEQTNMIEISIGDYIITGGEIASLVLVDSISRLLPGVLGNQESIIDESFTNHLLEYPQYTRPKEFMGKEVPGILLSGHHAKIKEWRLNQSERITKERRPDLYNEYCLKKNKV